MPEYLFDPPERFVAGTIGEPGERAFYLQASAGGRTVTVGLEKIHVAALAERLNQVLDELLRQLGPEAGVPAATPRALEDVEPLELPVLEEFRVEQLALAWDAEDRRVVIEASAAEPESGAGAEGEPSVLRVRLTPAAARAFASRALRVVAAGRPPCPLCGLPLDPSGHVCPRQNGHRA
ncbi:MAG: DUF3090 family protein [Mycobacteriales bacterium]